MQVEKDRAYFLHAKPYRDSSLLAHLLTQQHGKVSFIVSGAKSAGRGKAAKNAKTALLQPCRPLVLSYQLKNGLSKIIDAELHSNQPLPNIRYFMHYQYVHELLLKLLPEQLPDENLFTVYTHFLDLLCQGNSHFALRLMELGLIDFFDGISGIYADEQLRTHVDTSAQYFLEHSTGISRYPAASTTAVSGQQLSAFNHIVALYQQQLSDNKSKDLPHVVNGDIRETLAREAQPISAFLIARLLGDKTLNTRQIYRELQSRQLL